MVMYQESENVDNLNCLSRHARINYFSDFFVYYHAVRVNYLTEFVLVTLNNYNTLKHYRNNEIRQTLLECEKLGMLSLWIVPLCLLYG